MLLSKLRLAMPLRSIPFRLRVTALRQPPAARVDRVPELLMVITPALRPVRQSSPIIDPDPKALYEMDSPILIGAGRDKRQITPTRRPKRRSKDSKN